jgi:hypothetical protein
LRNRWRSSRSPGAGGVSPCGEKSNVTTILRVYTVEIA